MRHTTAIRSLVLLSTFTIAAAIGCQSDDGENSDPETDFDPETHCFAAKGDETCLERFGPERRFCVGPGECEEAPVYEGCVEEPPRVECYSPCGNNALAAEDTSCLESDDETGSGSESGDGDGDEDPVCGNGLSEAGEECDDGNLVDDDECSNTCKAASCGDGVVQRSVGEACDDGNMVSGDLCSSECLVPGTVVWDKVYDDIAELSGYGVAIAPDGRLRLSVYSAVTGHRVVGVGADGEIEWDAPAPAGSMQVAVGPSGEVVVGGTADGKGVTWMFDAEGEQLWAKEVPLASTSTINDVAVDGGGNVVAVGQANTTIGTLLRYSPAGEFQAFLQASDGDAFTDVAVDLVGNVWTIRKTPRQLERYGTQNELVWTSSNFGLFGEVYSDLALDNYGNAYIVGSSSGLDSFGLAKIDAEGVFEWLETFDTPAIQEAGLGVAVLPNGGALVAGFTNNDGVNDETDALLTWFAPNGLRVLDIVLDGEDNNDIDILWGVAVSTEGYAVAVGFHEAMYGRKLWLRKFVI